MLVEKLTDNEIQMITDYRNNYAYSDSANSVSNNFAETSFVLREWDSQKSKFLYKLLGEKFMVSKHLSYKKSYEELQDEIANFTERRYGRTERSGEQFMRDYMDLVYPASFSKTSPLSEEQQACMRRLISDDCLIENKYDGAPFDIDLPNGKKYRVSPGCKVGKALGKIANIFNLRGYEDFRICHSQVLNQKELGGNLTISIHPLDYMTMSDNECDWESCMSWRNEGGYRRGTVEMMNSECVVVAYLTADQDMKMWGSNGRPNGTWNNKKWRQLFVINQNLIISVKDYPYHNSDLTHTVVKMLRDMAKENLGWTYFDPQTYQYDGDRIHTGYLPEEKDDFRLEIVQGAMYNDFGCLDYHWLCVSDDIAEEEIYHQSWGHRYSYLQVPYSGRGECMICGELCCDFEDESCLACYECQDRLRCDCCGELICDDAEYIDGMTLCRYCYENRVHECVVCGEYHYEDNMNPVFVIPRISPEKQEILRENFYVDYRYAIHDYPKDDYPEMQYYLADTDIWVCESNDEELDRWVENNLREGCKLHRREMRWNSAWYVYYDELTPQAQEDYVYGYNGDADAYERSFQFNQAYPSRIIKDF